jgi:N-acetylmuramoyl-L-alanine amidase
VTEVHINWTIAVELRELLEESGVRVVMTKSEEDEYVTNRERSRIANECGADLFFRIHCDTAVPEARGMTFYYPDRQGTWEGETGPPLELIPACCEAARTIHDAAMSELDGLLRDRGVKTDNDTVVGNRQGGALRGSILSRVPVVLVEVCFLSNADDVALVTDPAARSRIVSALASGILAYVGTPQEPPSNEE